MFAKLRAIQARLPMRCLQSWAPCKIGCPKDACKAESHAGWDVTEMLDKLTHSGWAAPEMLAKLKAMQDRLSQRMLEKLKDIQDICPRDVWKAYSHSGQAAPKMFVTLTAMQGRLSQNAWLSSQLFRIGCTRCFKSSQPFRIGCHRDACKAESHSG